MIKEASYPIKYIYKENGGKHTAINVGIQEIRTELIFIVDSDDTLTKDAVELILRYHEKYKSIDGLCGYSFLRQFPDGNINGNPFEREESIGSYINMRINKNDTLADKAEVFYTKCLKEFPFPEYPGERFLGEDLVWIRMARKYNMVHINKAIYIGTYMEDGLTKNRRKHNIASPIGCMHRAEEFMESDINLKYRIKGSLQYIIYGLFANYSIGNLLKASRHKLLTSICVFPGIILYMKWKKEYAMK